MEKLEEVLSPEEAPYELQDSSLTPEQRPTLRQLLNEGITAFPEILERLAPFINSKEAAAAQQATRQSISALRWSALGLAILAILFKLPAAEDLLTASSLLIALVLVSRYRIPYAGRLFVVSAALMTSFLASDAFFTFASSIGAFLSALLLGSLVDYGASTELHRRRPRLRRLALLLAGSLYVYQAVIQSEEGPLLGFSLVAGLITCAWGWWPAPLFERWARLRDADADILWMLGMKRWAFVALGPFLAVTALVFPFFLFLHNLEGEDQLQNPKIIKTGAEGGQHVWFWPFKGSYLKPDDLEEKEFYAMNGYASSEVESLRLSLVLAQFPPFRKYELTDDPASIYRQIQEKLKDHRLTRENYKEMLREEDGELKIYFLARIPANGEPKLFAVDTLAAHTSSQNPWKWLFLAYGSLGFIMLWRRGGDSRLGRWIGLWFVGTGTLTLSISQSVLPLLQGVLYRMSGNASQSPLGTLACTAISLLILASMGIVFLWVSCVTCAAIWTHTCWPAPRSEGRIRWFRRLARAGKVPLVTVCMALLFYLPLYRGKGSLPATILGITLFTLVTFGTGYLLQRRKSIQKILIPINRTAGFVLLAVQAVVMAAVATEAEFFSESSSEDLVHSLTQTSFLCGIVFFVFVSVLIFKKNLLHLSPARDYSFLVTILVVMLAWSEERLPTYVTVFTGELASARAREILAVVFAVGLLPPLRSWIERKVLYATQSGLREIEQKIHTTLEGLTDLWQPESLSRIDKLLKEVCLGSALLYVRRGQNLFRTSGTVREEIKDGFLISQPLRRHLAESNGFLDLHRLAYSWRYFFFQFELYRIRLATQGRFLLPVCLGGSLRAILVIPEQKKKAQVPVGESLTGDIAQLGLIATQVRAIEGTSEAA